MLVLVLIMMAEVFSLFNIFRANDIHKVRDGKQDNPGRVLSNELIKTSSCELKFEPIFFSDVMI